jgi:hypothetical protein
MEFSSMMRVASSSLELLYGLPHDLRYFAAPTPTAEISVQATLAPPWEPIPNQSANSIRHNAVIYDAGAVRDNDYRHEALAIYDFASERGEV